MSINEILKNNGGGTLIVVSANDLKEFAANVVEQTRKDIEKDAIERNSETYLSAQQVCLIFGIDSTTLWRWSKRNYLKPIKIGGMNRYKKTEVDKIIECRK